MRYFILFFCIYSLGLYAEEKELELPAFHHVVNIKPSDGRKIDKAFELGENGELVCYTCHGLKDIDKTPIDEVDTKAKDFLNGGPYKPLTGFCYRCHDKKSNRRENIHILLDERGDIKEESCKYCHEDVPERDKPLKIDELKLRLPIEQICFGCHLRTPHFNAVEHQNKPKEDKMLEHLKMMRKKKSVFMPLGKDNKVMCVSCHTPHQKGVININKPAGKQVDNDDLEKGVTYVDHPWSAIYRADKKERLTALNQKYQTDYVLDYQRLDKEVLVRLSAKDGQLCLMCHTFKD
jgi:hypothetical protein